MAHEKSKIEGAAGVGEPNWSAALAGAMPAELTNGAGPPPLPVDAARRGHHSSDIGSDLDKDAANEPEMDRGRRVARRRPAGPARAHVAANDDAPTIGGLIFALEQKPSNRPFFYAGVFSAVWGLLGTGIAALSVVGELEKGATLFAIVTSPVLFLTVAAIGLPIGVIWFLALLAWRAEELRLRSSTMTEVAVRLAEPDRMAEQSIASLGQNVRRQVSFMNDAVSRALGRAGELEALVHSEVAALDRSYEENEKRIRGLIQELSGERHALLNTSERVAVTLRTLGSEVPTLIDRLAEQQIKLSGIIAGAGDNLTALETAMTQSAGQLETTLGSRTTHLQSVLEGYTTALATVLSARSEEMQAAFDDQIRVLDTSLGNRTENLQTVFEEYALALDTTLANRSQALDVQLVERTASLDAAFTRRLEVFDASIQRSTLAIDGAVNERATALTNALDTHAKTFRETISRQAGDFDESLMQGINAVRRTSENITRQSLKAIEGLANQSDMLKNVSENLLGQIHSVTNRFETQGVQILKAANTLETVNTKIDATLKNRHSDLTRTLEQIAGTTDTFGKAITSYSTTIEDTMGEAERRARLAADEMRSGAEYRSRVAMAEIEQLRSQTVTEGERAIDDVRRRFTSATGEVQQQIGSLSQQVNEATLDVRNRSVAAAAELAQEQARMRSQLESMPAAARESTDAMRRSLQDQLMALDKLNQLTTRTAQLRDVTPPAGGPGGSFNGEGTRALSSLTQPMIQPVAQPLPAEQFAPRPRSPADYEQAQNWSFGDLLARAAKEEDAMHIGGQNFGQGYGSPPQGGMGGGSDRATPFSLNVGVIARALDAATADALWSRLRSGQRGIMVRSIYSPEGRVAFDEISRRAATDPDLQATIGRYLTDFERILKDAETRDPSGRALQSQLVSDTGRVYLFLAHASGRLA